MRHLVFVYGTLLRGEVNHRLLGEAKFVGPHRTEPCFTMFNTGAYPALVRGGQAAAVGEVFDVDETGLLRLDRLEDYPRLYDRVLIPTPYGRAWVYLYRGSVKDMAVIPMGDWRRFAANPDSIRSAAVRATRDPKNPAAPSAAAEGP